METIGLIAAMSQECDALHRCTNGWKRISMGTFSGSSFEISGQTCLLVTSGMGVRRASGAAQVLMEMYSPRTLISFGIAGAVEQDLQIGNVITSEAVCHYENGLTGPLLSLASWPEASKQAAAQVLSSRGAHLFSGTAVTTGGSQVKESQLENIIHPILEMETAGIAQVAAEKGVPLLSLRAISDGPIAPLPFDLGEMMDENANLQTGRMMKAMIQNPKIMFQLRRLLRNSRVAADNAAIALKAAISHMNP